MPDPISAEFKPGWRLKVPPAKDGPLSFADVMLVQEAWRRLTLRSRKALLAIAEQPGSHVYHGSRDCLLRRGLITEKNNLTRAGRAVVRHRPIPKALSPLAGRPVIDVHLPEVIS